MCSSEKHEVKKGGSAAVRRKEISEPTNREAIHS
jgi:hypothetical protein